MSNPGARARLFLALWPSAATLERLQAFQGRCVWPAGARRTPARNLHVTLHFIGDVERERVAELVDAAAAPTSAMSLEFDRCERWGRGLAVLVAQQVPQSLRDLHEALASRLRVLALPVESRPYRPHITLARDAAGFESPFGVVDWRSSGHSLVESAGGQYRVLSSYSPS
jgi:2'-5' RNA ligase